MPETQETQVPSLGQEDPLDLGMATHSSILSGKSHGQRSLVGYSPWGCKELDTAVEKSWIRLSQEQARLRTHAAQRPTTVYRAHACRGAACFLMNLHVKVKLTYTILSRRG